MNTGPGANGSRGGVCGGGGHEKKHERQQEQQQLPKEEHAHTPLREDPLPGRTPSQGGPPPRAKATDGAAMSILVGAFRSPGNSGRRGPVPLGKELSIERPCGSAQRSTSRGISSTLIRPLEELLH